MRVAMIAPPWLALPIQGYGGVELVIEGLVEGLRRQGVEVVLFANGEHHMKGVKTYSLYNTNQFINIHRPYYESLPILQAHLEFALNKIREDGNFDVIHDHNPLIGPTFFSLATHIPGVPPALHTFHGPPFSTPETIKEGIPDNRLELDQLRDMGSMYMVPISKALGKFAPRKIKSHLLDAVHNAIEIEQFPFVEKKGRYFITLARFTPEKGQHIAAQLAEKLNTKLKMAGTVAGMTSIKQMLFELSNPLSRFRSDKEFRYYSDKILPHVIGHKNIKFVGNLSGAKKMKFISHAKALLFPIEWEEPFGMAVIEALACGTPVVAMRRGAMPEIIQHGVNGFLADTMKEFEEYMQRVDEINPRACRDSVAKMFSADVMAKNYIKRYEEVIERSKLAKQAA